MPPPKLRTPELGDRLLRSALIAVERGDHALTARHVASAAGTSTAALYELFGDKAGLIRAVFYEGFRQLDLVCWAVPVTADAYDDLVALLAATRQFAMAHPMLFDIMFGRPFGEFEPSVADHQAGAGIYRSVMSRVDRFIAAIDGSGNRVDVAQVLIATNRGLIAAELAGTLGSTSRSTNRRWRLAIDSMLSGIGAATVRTPRSTGA